MTAREALEIVTGFVQAISPSQSSPVWDAIDEIERLVDSIDTRDSQARDQEHERRT